MIDEIKGFADDVNRLREQSKLMESFEKAAQVRNFISAALQATCS